MRKILEKLFKHHILNKQEAKDILTKISANKFPDAQVMAFMTVYQMRPISVEELAGFREALLDLCIPIDLTEFNTIDMCGTGGDGKNTFNISTIASFIVAGAGYKVAKHGNYGVSSVSGSSNVLEAMGYQFTNDEETLQNQIRKANITFLHAPKFHPAMAAVGPLRRQLKMKTFFNMLGPIVNPSRPQNQLAGVFSLELARLYNYIFQGEKEKNFAIVHSIDGYDEVSLTSDFHLRTNTGESLITINDLGLETITQEEIFGGDTIEEAVAIFKKVISGNGTEAQHNVVCANAALAIQIMKTEKHDFQTCFKEAKKALLSGKAIEKLEIITHW